MKHNLIKQLQQMAASFYYFFGIIAFIFLIALAVNRLINDVIFWICIAALIGFGYLDAKWLDKHFVDGECV